MLEDFPLAVYVHFGSNLPKHLELGLIRHKSLFPEQRVILIVDQLVKISDLKGIEIQRLNSLDLQKDLFDLLSKHLDFNFRDGFWKYTLQRFFALTEFHKSVPHSRIVHIESDVLVMPEFPWNKFSGLQTAAWLKVNDTIDVAAIIFLPNYKASSFLSREIVRFAQENPKINDMQALHEFASQNPAHHIYLPSLTPNTARSLDYVGAKETEFRNYFGGIFDPLILGLWNFGQDPKNSFGIRRRYVDDTNHNLNPQTAFLTYSNGILLDKNGTHVFSLHLHAKFLPLFGAEWEYALIKGLRQSAKKSNRISFHFNAFIAAIKSRKFRENFWILLALIPGIRLLRKNYYIETTKNRLKKLLRI